MKRWLKLSSFLALTYGFGLVGQAFKNPIGVVVLVTSFCLVAFPAKAQFNYTVTNQTVTITGYTATNRLVAIPSTINGLPVTSIGYEAFYGSSSCIISVTIPNSVTSIGGSAFYLNGCLTNVTIPDSVTNIGDYAFYLCGTMTSVTIPNSVTSIGQGAFGICSLLTKVAIPNSVTSIGNSVFFYCGNLTSVTIPNSVTSIGDQAFYACSRLTDVTLGSVTSVGDYAFANCTGLRSLYFQGNAPSVGGTNVFLADTATIYYLPGTVGWGSTFQGLPTAVWTLPYPVILTSTPTFGVHSNQFAFTVSWATNLDVVVEASHDLANPIWSPVQTNALDNGVVNFTDPEWTNHPSRFYRVRSL